MLGALRSKASHTVRDANGWKGKVLSLGGRTMPVNRKRIRKLRVKTYYHFIVLTLLVMVEYSALASEFSTSSLSARELSDRRAATFASSTKATTATLASASVPDVRPAGKSGRPSWLAPLTSSPAELISSGETGSVPRGASPSIRLFVYDRVNKCAVKGLALYGVSSVMVGGPFVTNDSGFATLALAKGHERDESVELEVMGNYQPIFDEQVRLWPSNASDRRFRLSLKPTAKDTVFLPVVPVVRAEVSVYELPYKRMINVPVTLTPLQAVVREPLTLTAGAEDEPEAARFAIPAHEGDTYRVSVGENLNVGPKDIGIFTVRRYREPIELRINLYAGSPPLEVITTEH